MKNNTRLRFYGFIYLIYIREFINANKDIYKIGCCEDIEQRKRQYPKGSILLFTQFTTNYIEIETKIKETFVFKYIPRRDCGIEYFEGDHHEMVNDMFDIVKNNNTYRKNEYKEEIIQKKTLDDFINETMLIDKNKTSTGVDSSCIHKYYTDVWLKNNQTNICFYNIHEFINKISKVIGRPVNNMFIGRFLIDKTFKIENNENVYEKYIHSRLIKTNNKMDRLKQSNINKDFALWINKNYPNFVYMKTHLTIEINKLFQKSNRYKFLDGNSTVGWIYIMFKE